MLIILRGNSGSGKTTVAKELQKRFGRNTMLISQDNIRREMLNVEDGKDTKAIPLMKQLLEYGNERPEKNTSGKHDFIVRTLRKALVKSFLGKTVNIKIDRPMGSRHPRHPEMIYPVNYGFIPNVYSGDGAELDVYLLGVDVPVREYTASVIGIIYREDDVEDKLVAAPDGIHFSKEEIQAAVNFQEQFFKYTIEVL